MSNAAAETKTITAVLVGNPNTGKTTLFNALTGLRHHVGNYPGVTVETKSGTSRLGGARWTVFDVPGTYSLSPRSPDEMLTVDILLGRRADVPRPDVAVCIVDASNLDRNLYLATQVFELGVPVVLALNMTDIAAARGIEIDADKLAANLGIPVVPIQANSRRGLTDLARAILEAASQPPPERKPEFPGPFQHSALDLEAWARGRTSEPINAYLLERAILDVNGYCETILEQQFGPELKAQLQELRTKLKEAGCGVPGVEARTRYGWIADRLHGAVRRPQVRKETLSDRIDRIVMHRFWGVLIFLTLMAIVFQSIYTWAEPLMGVVEGAQQTVGNAVARVLPEGPVEGLVVDGIIAGVGGVLVFLPQIVILFGFIAVLEDCGYMARAAFLMDKLMSRCGLSGKSFIPLLSSFACAIPGIMAARTIEDRRDRLTTILVAPLMSCSARLPVYVVLIGAFIPATPILGLWNLQGLTLLSMYLIGLVLAPLVAWTLKRTIIGGPTPIFLMELPSYKLPSLGTVLHRMSDRGLAFVQRAGSVILATSIVLWALQYYPRPTSVAAEFEPRIAALQSQLSESPASAGGAPNVAATTGGQAASGTPSADAAAIEDEIARLEHEQASRYQEQSLLGRMGKAIEPAVKPLGWDWRIGMAAIASFPAREVVLAALGTIYSVGNEVDEESVPLREALQSSTWPDGTPVFNVPVALSLMVFFALCCQCAATLAVIRRETNTWRWPLFTFVYMTALAYVAALAVYQVGIRLT